MSAGELIPEAGLVDMDMSLVPMGSSRMGASGNSIVGRFGPTRWKLRVLVNLAEASEAREWDPWIANRVDLGETFTAWRLLRLKPRAGILTPDGALTLTVNAPTDQVTIGGVGVDGLSKGDMISYRTAANGYYLGMVQANVAASAGSVTPTLRPKPMAKHATTPAVRRVQALGEFELSTPLEPFDDYSTRQIAFEAIQIVR